MLQFMTTKGYLTIVRGERAGVDVLYIQKKSYCRYIFAD